MISTISGSPQVPQPLPGAGSNKAKEASLEKQIVAKDIQAKTTTCADTAAQMAKEVAALRAELGALEAQDKSTNAAGSTSNAPVAANPAKADAAQSVTPADSRDELKKGGDDYRPFAARASTAVQIALANLNTVDQDLANRTR